MNRNTPKKALLCLLTALLLVGGTVGCTKDTVPSPDNGTNNLIDPNLPIDQDALNDLINEAEKDGPILPEGDLTEIWFDELFRAYYPKQLEDIYPTRVYVYGELETTQPVMCFCSKDIFDLEVCSFENGTIGEALYTVEKMAPMETLVLQVEVGEEPNFLLRFRDAEETAYTYTVARNADDTEIVLEAAPVSAE